MSTPLPLTKAELDQFKPSTFWASIEARELTAAFQGRTIVWGDRPRMIVSFSSYDGGVGVYFGGPGRGCDHGDSWVYLTDLKADAEGNLRYKL